MTNVKQENATAVADAPLENGAAAQKAAEVPVKKETVAAVASEIANTQTKTLNAEAEKETSDESKIVQLFTPLKIRGLTLPNRVMLSPMCMYNCDNKDGKVSDFHVIHYATRAVGRVGTICLEATSVTPDGRISPEDLGIWDDAHVDGLKRVTAAIKANGAVAAIQLAHAGRKAGTKRPWDANGPIKNGGPVDSKDAWPTVSASAIPWNEKFIVPRELSTEEVREYVQKFAKGAERALKAGFQIVEVHAAHGYLVHQFLSAETNKRTDVYGGSFENRIRFLVEIVDAIRKVWPEDLPVFVRISAVDHLPAPTNDTEATGWSIEDSVALARVLTKHGVDLLDCSSGAISTRCKYPKSTQGYQVPYAEAVRAEPEDGSQRMLSAAVGGIKDAAYAESIVAEGKADVVCLGRELLVNPYWAVKAAESLGNTSTPWIDNYEWVAQYMRAPKL